MKKVLFVALLVVSGCGGGIKDNFVALPQPQPQELFADVKVDISEKDAVINLDLKVGEAKILLVNSSPWSNLVRPTVAVTSNNDMMGIAQAQVDWRLWLFTGNAPGQCIIVITLDYDDIVRTVTINGTVS